MNIKVILSALALTFTPVLALSATLDGKVIWVADGDTFTVLDAQHTKHKVRLQGIDAPENGQPFGSVSKRSLSDMIHGKLVTVVYENKDQYGRWLGKVLIGKTDINLLQIEKGLAWHYRAYDRELSENDRYLYRSTESHARSEGLGLWSEKYPMEPWKYRKSKKKPVDTAF